MHWRKWRWPVALLVLCIFIGLYILLSGEAWIQPRKAALATQFGTSITSIGPKLVLAGVILVATMLLGRWYCSLLCPAGILQEVFHRIGQRLGISKVRYKAAPSPLYLPLFVFACSLSGAYAATYFVEPIALFGRLFPVHGDRNGTLFADGGTALYGLLAALLFVAGMLIAVPLFHGRFFCDRMCLVGSLLNLASNSGGRNMTLDPKRCVACGKCERVCPSRCMDSGEKRLDRGRCVLCLECMDVCPANAVNYGLGTPATARRTFMEKALSAACVGGLALARETRPDWLGGAETEGVLPPGAVSGGRFAARCVTCQACIQSCPVGILVPDAAQRPILDYNRGYCQYNCVACSHSCPAGAFTPLSPEEKHVTRIARTDFYLDRCVVLTQGTECGACAEVCPTHAVSMKETEKGEPTQPDFDPEYCIGCGACYHVCPAEPRAFIITGLGTHERSRGVRPWGRHESDDQTHQPAPADDESLTDFPF